MNKEAIRDAEITSFNNRELSAGQKTHLEKLRLTSSRFDHADQIGLCVKLIALACTLLDKSQRDGIRDSRIKDVNLRTKKDLLKTLIRISSESSNHGQTVDFVSYDALVEKTRVSDIKKNNIKEKKRAKLAGDIFNPVEAKEKLSHEHMVPCEAVFDNVLNSKDDTDLSILMSAVGFRALIYRGDKLEAKTEHKRLDEKYKSSIPKLIKVADFPLEFYPFARYEAVGLYSSLCPVSQRGIELWSKYEKIRTNYFSDGVWKYKD